MKWWRFSAWIGLLSSLVALVLVFDELNLNLGDLNRSLGSDGSWLCSSGSYHDSYGRNKIAVRNLMRDRWRKNICPFGLSPNQNCASLIQCSLDIIYGQPHGLDGDCGVRPNYIIRNVQSVPRLRQVDVIRDSSIKVTLRSPGCEFARSCASNIGELRRNGIPNYRSSVASNNVKCINLIGDNGPQLLPIALGLSCRKLPLFINEPITNSASDRQDRSKNSDALSPFRRHRLVRTLIGALCLLAGIAIGWHIAYPSDRETENILVWCGTMIVLFVATSALVGTDLPMLAE